MSTPSIRHLLKKYKFWATSAGADGVRAASRDHPAKDEGLANLSHIPPLVLLAGPPRSGTTWLNREICDRDGWHGFLPECTLVTQQIALYSRTRHYCEPKRFSAYFGTVQNLVFVYRTIVAQMLGVITSVNDCSAAKVLVLKDPELSLYLEDLNDILPDHRLICLIRDPRDVIASAKNVSIRKQEAWDIETASAWIFTYYHSLGKYHEHAGQNCLFVRYEDLVAHGLEKVRHFLNQASDHHSANSEQYTDVSMNLDKSDPFFSDLYLQPTTQKAVGSYTNILTSQEINHIQDVFSGIMDYWKYK